MAYFQCFFVMLFTSDMIKVTKHERNSSSRRETEDVVSIWKLRLTVVFLPIDLRENRHSQDFQSFRFLEVITWSDFCW